MPSNAPGRKTRFWLSQQQSTRWIPGLHFACLVSQRDWQKHYSAKLLPGNQLYPGESPKLTSWSRLQPYPQCKFDYVHHTVLLESREHPTRMVCWVHWAFTPLHRRERGKVTPPLPRCSSYPSPRVQQLVDFITMPIQHFGDFLHEHKTQTFFFQQKAPN